MPKSFTDTVADCRGQLCGLDAGWRADPVLHRPGPAPATAASVPGQQENHRRAAAAYTTGMKALRLEQAPGHAGPASRGAAGAQGGAGSGRGRVDTTFQAGDKVMLRSNELPVLDATEVGKQDGPPADYIFLSVYGN